MCGVDLATRIEIHDDCWIGTNVVIMPNVTVGRGSIIGANSVITKNVAPYQVVAGVPAKVISTRLNFSPPTEIRYNQSADNPYFSFGFDDSYEPVIPKESFDGRLVIDDCFTLSLCKLGSKRLNLTVLIPDNQICKLECNLQIITVETPKTDISFSLPDECMNSEYFNIKVHNKPATLAINRAWLS
jgi:hypothetical protein